MGKMNWFTTKKQTFIDPKKYVDSKIPLILMSGIFLNAVGRNFELVLLCQFSESVT